MIHIYWIFSSMLSIPETDQNVSEDTYSSAIVNLEMSVCNETMFFCLEVCSNVYDCKTILSLQIWTPLCFRNLKTIFQKIQSRNCLLDSLMSWQQRVQSMTRHKCFLQKPLPQNRCQCTVGVHSLVTLLRGWSFLVEGIIHRFKLYLGNLCTSHLV